MRLLEDLHPLDKRYFSVPTGRELVIAGQNGEPDKVVHNLEELSETISELYFQDNAGFVRYANADHNIFADWVETVYGEDRLAALMRHRPSFSNLCDAIQRFVSVNKETILANQEREPIFKGALALTTVRQIFEQSDLPFPPIPAALEDEFQIYGRWFFGTRFPLPASPYMGVREFIAEFERGDAPDYLLIVHDGHGSNSYGLHFYLVQGPLGIFLQLPWGGVYTDPDHARAYIAKCFDGAERLISAASGAVARGQLTSATPLTLVVSFRLGDRATWLGNNASDSEASSGKKSLFQALDEMIAAVSSNSFSAAKKD